MDLKQVGKHNAQHTCDQYPQERTRHGGGAPPLEAVDQGDDQQGEGQSNRQADQDGVPALEVEGHQNLPQHQHRQHEGDDGPQAGTPGEEDQEHGEDGGQQSLLADAVVVIDTSWLNKYEKWLRSKDNKETTISLMFRTLRSTYNKAIKAKCARKSDYPFDEYKVNKFDTTTQKRAIAKTDVLKFTTEVQPIGKQQYMELSKDIFVFSYLCGGINFTDIANLTNENIQNGRLHYIRQKTKKLIKIGIPQEAMLIIEKYSKESKGYLFPILDSKIHKTALQKQNRIHKILGKVNKNLKLLAAQLGVEANLTTYVARHSFASVLKKSGVNIALISEALGHSDLATTQIYLDSFDNEQVDEAMKNLL